MDTANAVHGDRRHRNRALLGSVSPLQSSSAPMPTADLSLFACDSLEFSYFIIPWSFGLAQAPSGAFILYSQIQAYRQLGDDSRTVHVLGLSGSAAPVSSGVQITTVVEREIDVAGDPKMDEKLRELRV